MITDVDWVVCLNFDLSSGFDRDKVGSQSCDGVLNKPILGCGEATGRLECDDWWAEFEDSPFRDIVGRDGRRNWSGKSSGGKRRWAVDLHRELALKYSSCIGWVL